MPEDVVIARFDVVEFVNWLYEEGPNPDDLTRSRLLSLYYSQKAEKAIAEGLPRYVPDDGLLPLLRHE